MAQDGGVKIMADGRGGRERQARNDSEDRGEGDRRNEAEKGIAADGMRQMDRRHIAATAQAPLPVKIGGIGADKQDRAKADDEGQDIEIADPAGRPEDRLARLLRVRDGEEAHQYVRQARRAEHERKAEGDGGHGVLDEAAGRHDGAALLGCLVRRCAGGQRGLRLHLDGAGEQGFQAEAGLRQHHHRHEARAAQQQHRLDDLDPCGRPHAAEQDIEHHEATDDHHGGGIGQAKQQFDELPRAHHLRDEVEADDQQRADRREAAHRRLGEAVGGDIGEGVATKVPQPFGHQEQEDRPANEEAGGINEAVIAIRENLRRYAQEGGGRHIVARHGEAVLETGDAAARGIEIRRGTGARGRRLGDPERQADKGDEHRDRHPVDGLALRLPLQRGGEGGRGQQQGPCRKQRLHAP